MDKKAESEGKLKPNECAICSKILSSRTNLRRHIATIHLVTPKRQFCPLCDKSFTRKDNLKIHAKKAHDNANLGKDKKRRKTPWKQIIASKPKTYIPPPEARICNKVIRRKSYFPDDDLSALHQKNPSLINCKITDIPKELRPSENTRQKDNTFGPTAIKAKKENNITKLWIRRTRLIQNKMYCTADDKQRPKFITRFQRWDRASLITIRKNDDEIKSGMAKEEKIYRIEHKNNFVSLITQKEIATPEESAFPYAQEHQIENN